MASDNQSSWAGRGPVVSVRLEKELVDRLDILAQRTGRSRGTYLRMALWAMIPRLEAVHWKESTKEFEENAVPDTFEEIIQQLKITAEDPPTKNIKSDN